MNSENERAVIEAHKARDFAKAINSETERSDCERQTEILIRKIEIEMTNSTKIGNINDAAYLASSKLAESKVS